MATHVPLQCGTMKWDLAIGVLQATLCTHAYFQLVFFLMGEATYLFGMEGMADAEVLLGYAKSTRLLVARSDGQHSWVHYCGWPCCMIPRIFDS